MPARCQDRQVESRTAANNRDLLEIKFCAPTPSTCILFTCFDWRGPPYKQSSPLSHHTGRAGQAGSLVERQNTCSLPFHHLQLPRYSFLGTGTPLKEKKKERGKRVDLRPLARAQPPSDLRLCGLTPSATAPQQSCCTGSCVSRR